MSTFKTRIYDLRFLDINLSNNRSELIHEFLLQDISRKISEDVKSKLFETSSSIEHFCFECKAKININIFRYLIYDEELSKRDFLCEAHKSKKISNYSLTFFKYEHSFYQKLKNILQHETIHNILS